MCRVLSYLGKPIVVEDLLYKPDNSFIKQSYNPKHMSHLLNLAGYGLVAWDKNSHNPTLPFTYKTSLLPFYDENLRNLAAKIEPSCLLTHIRGVAYSEKRVVSNQNVHPFIFDGATIALAHNGSLTQFERMKFDLLDFIDPKYSKSIRGTTDSEWIYAVFLSQLPQTTEYNSKDITEAFVKTFKILKKVRAKYNIEETSPVNLFISNGEFIAATRFALDFGWTPLEPESLTHLAYHSLWYTYGEGYGFYENEFKMKEGQKKSCIIIASEPLTEDTTTWIEVPEYTLLIAWREQDEIKIFSHDIEL